MTDHQLRDLLHDHVADLAPTDLPDLAGRAWRAGERVRRRRRLGVVAGAAAATVAVTGGVVTLTRPGSESGPGPAGSPMGSPRPSEASPRPTYVPPASDAPDAHEDGVPVWWAPDQLEERTLPLVGSSPLPPEIDLAAAPAVGGGERPAYALAAFAVGAGVVLVGPEGALSAVDPGGAVTDTMLSPDGRWLAVPGDGSVRVMSVPTGTWRTVDVGGRSTRHLVWVAERAFALPTKVGGVGKAYDVRGHDAGRLGWPVNTPPFDQGGAQPYGRWRSNGVDLSAQAWGRGAGVAARSGSLLDPEFLSIAEPVSLEVSAVLALTEADTGGQDGRWLQCCPVASWLDRRTVVYESRQREPALVAWTVGTHRFRLVSRVRGTYEVASFARLWDDLTTPYLD